MWDSKIDSHTELLEKFGIKDDSTEPNFVRVEINPKEYSKKGFKDLSSWVFKTDQDLLPKWYKKKDAEERTRKALKDYAEKYVHINKRVKELTEGRHWLFGTTVVKKMYDSAVVQCMFDFSVVKEMYSSSVVKKMHDSSAFINLLNKTITIPKNSFKVREL